MYGPAGIETDSPGNGINIWYKRTNNLIIDKWYKEDTSGTISYQEDPSEDPMITRQDITLEQVRLLM